MKGIKIIWTEIMIDKLKREFSNRFSRDIGNEMGISIRSVIRKARELGLEKEAEFLEKNRGEISVRANSAKAPNPNKGNKNFRIPGGEKHQFKKGERKHIPNYSSIHEKRNETIRKEKMRIRYGLPQRTNLNLKNIWE